MPPSLEEWFAGRGWTPFEFQREAWAAYLSGRSGLVHAPTGMGKTLAVWLGPVIEGLRERDAGVARGSAVVRENAEPLRVLWITPLRALAGDTVRSLREPITGLSTSGFGLSWTVEPRTGDTSASVRARQRERLPTCLVTTPESLSIMLSYPDWRDRLESVRCVIVDEWHELMGSKRGVQVELALARLRGACPSLRVWGLSATIGNTEHAARALVGTGSPEPALIRGAAPKRIEVETLLPDAIENYPWSGHIGTRLAARVIERVRGAGTTLLFTNTRSQAEIWFRAILTGAPDLLGAICLHHGSLDRAIRDEVEGMLRDGRARCVVCTSSLDLGVDFSPVDQVIQIGSPKGLARLIQRAGRSGHRPGAVSRIAGVPTHAFELIEFAAAREAIEGGRIEDRVPPSKPLDVLTQHLVTCAVGGGFVAEELHKEVRSTRAFAELTEADWAWALEFVTKGGASLGAYDKFQRVAVADGLYKIASARLATMHRLAIGTIVADPAVTVRYASGRTVGSVEESFIGRLRPGDRFVFHGKTLELLSLREMTALVKPARQRSGAVPQWNGGRMPLSSQLADAVRLRVQRAGEGDFSGPEVELMRGLLERQGRESRLPRADELLIEHTLTDEGHHAFLFPFAGRLVHEGLGALLSYRVSKLMPATITATATDYGVELLSNEAIELEERAWRGCFMVDGLLEDLVEAIHATQLARRHFREIARIAGLTHPGYPGKATSMRHVQASSEMFYDVFCEFEPGNLLLGQARREVVEEQVEFSRLESALRRMGGEKIVIVRTDRLTPMAFPLFAERLRSTHVTSEQWDARVRRVVEELERGGDGQGVPVRAARKRRADA